VEIDATKVPEIAADDVQSPNEPKWSVGEALGVWFASVLLILLVPTLFLLPYLTTLSTPITDTDQLMEFARTDPTSIIVQLVGIIPAHLLTLGIAWLVVTRISQYRFRGSLGWERGGFRWWHYFLILAGFFALAVVVGHYFPEQENELLRILKSSREAVFVIAFIATVTAPIVEEVVYRGVVYSSFQAKFGIPAAFAFTTILFAVVHVPQYLPSYSTIFLLTLLSVILTIIRIISGNLLPCILLHMFFNGLQSAILIAEPYLKEHIPVEAVATLAK
jgi:membrane protease YdiL (CAAX protease family)